MSLIRAGKIMSVTPGTVLMVGTELPVQHAHLQIMWQPILCSSFVVSVTELGLTHHIWSSMMKQMA